MAPAKICFACVKNAGRSQMSCHWFNALVDPESATAVSAGSAPADHVQPEVVEAMKEVGIDVSGAVPAKLTRDVVASVTAVVTMGCGEACPYVPGVEVIAWQIPDPHGGGLPAVREIRDDLRRRVG